LISAAWLHTSVPSRSITDELHLLDIALGRNRLTDLGEQLAAAKPTAPRDPLKVPSADR